MNIEIIPNWHPVFVHFTIGLLSASTILLFSGVIFFPKVLGTKAAYCWSYQPLARGGFYMRYASGRLAGL